MHNPPVGFNVLQIDTAQGPVPAFSMLYNLLTTLDEGQNKFTEALRSSTIAGRICSVPTMFVGTTVSEHSLYPLLDSYETFVNQVMLTGWSSRCQLFIIKDLPVESPLLTAEANAASARLLDTCLKSGFTEVSGQALAYVPIDFETIDEYLTTKLSHSRRKGFRKKLKSRSQISVELAKTGDEQFSNSAFIDELYSLYANVYAQSKYHFDRLSRQFFETIFQDASSKGVVFLYRRSDSGKLVGWNLCYEQNKCLIDKYVGFAYPDARDVNLYFVSWFQNLEYCLANQLTHYVAGWTDPEVKTSLGAKFTLTKHAVYIRNPILRLLLTRFQYLFEPDKNWADKDKRTADSEPIKQKTTADIQDERATKK